MSGSFKLSVDDVAPNRKGVLRYVGGLDLIHVAFSIYVRGDVWGAKTRLEALTRRFSGRVRLCAGTR